MLENKKAVIFDLDGVLVHTDQFHRMAWEALAQRLGLVLRPEISRSMLGVSRMDSLELLLKDNGVQVGPEEKARLAEEKNASYRAFIVRMTPADVSREVRDTLAELRRRGLKLAVGSSSRNAGTILERVGLDGSFDVVVDGTQISRSKPDPEVFLKAAEYLQLEPQECLVVEDAIAGIEAAHAGCMDCATFGSIAISSLKAEYNIHAFSDLLAVFHK